VTWELRSVRARCLRRLAAAHVLHLSCGARVATVVPGGSWSPGQAAPVVHCTCRASRAWLHLSCGQVRRGIGLHLSRNPFCLIVFSSRARFPDLFRAAGFALTLHCRRASRPRAPGTPSLPPFRPCCHGASLLLGSAHQGLSGRPEHFFDWGVFGCCGYMVLSFGGAWLGLFPGPCRPGGTSNR